MRINTLASIEASSLHAVDAAAFGRSCDIGPIVGTLPSPGGSTDSDRRPKIATRRRFEERIKGLLPARFYYPRKIAKEAGRTEPELAILRDIVPVGLTAIDVGANRGYYSYALSQIASYVEAFEPNPELADFAAAKLGANVQVHQVALSNRPGTGTLYVPLTEKDFSLHLLGNLGQIHPSHRAAEIEVRLATLDSYSLHDIGFIKIDAEGSEMDIIEGARDTIERDRPTLLIELLTGAYRNPVEQIDQIQRAFDYDAWIVMNGGAMVQAHSALSAGADLSTRNVLFLPR